MPLKIFKEKGGLLGVFGIAVLAAGFWLALAPKAEAADWNYLHIKIDSDASPVLWQFHGFKTPYPHGGNLATGICKDTGGGDGICNAGNISNPANYDCGIWLVEEWPLARDAVALLWTKKGNKLSKSGTSIWNDLTNNGTDTSNISWNRGTGANNASDLCWDANIDTVAGFGTALLVCDFSDAWDMENTAKATYGIVNATATEDITLSNSAATTYRPDMDILCAGSNLWKTCEANDCATIGSNNYACDGSSGVWQKCPAATPNCDPATGGCIPASGSYTLKVVRTGSGTASSSPAGINCGTNCSAIYSAGTSVVLTAAADTGYLFLGWSGAGCSGTSTCTVNMTANRTVTATFSGSGGGIVGIFFGSPSKFKDLMELVDAIVGFLFYLVIPLAILLLVIAAFLFLTSAGDAQKVNTAKTLIFYTLLGLIIIISAKAIAALVKFAVS